MICHIRNTMIKWRLAEFHLVAYVYVVFFDHVKYICRFSVSVVSSRFKRSQSSKRRPLARCHKSVICRVLVNIWSFYLGPYVDTLKAAAKGGNWKVLFWGLTNRGHFNYHFHFCYVWQVGKMCDEYLTPPPPLPDRLSELKVGCPSGSWYPPDDIIDDIIPGPEGDAQH